MDNFEMNILYPWDNFGNNKQMIIKLQGLLQYSLFFPTKGEKNLVLGCDCDLYFKSITFGKGLFTHHYQLLPG